MIETIKEILAYIGLTSIILVAIGVTWWITAGPCDMDENE